MIRAVLVLALAGTAANAPETEPDRLMEQLGDDRFAHRRSHPCSSRIATNPPRDLGVYP